jgi:hypothetical protein
MPPRSSIPLTPEDKVVCARWSCVMLGTWIVIVIAALTLPIFGGESSKASRVQAPDRVSGASLHTSLPHTIGR